MRKHGLSFFAKFRIQNNDKSKEVIALKKEIKQYFKRRIDKYLVNNWNGSKELVDDIPDDVKERIHQEIDKVFKDNNIKEDLDNEQERTD